MSERASKRPLIVPIFIPHQGCPHRCVFCEQERITAQTGDPHNQGTIRQILDKAIASSGFHAYREREVAFYGGTFTMLPYRRMEELLGAAASYLQQGFFKSIRVSTRPDAIDNHRLRMLKSKGVRVVELGVQSMNDDVLAHSRRGHSAQDTVSAVQTLKNHGFKVGIQLMPGLPGDSASTFMNTIEETIRLQPDTVRLYPTIVIQGTQLARRYQQGKYQPLTLRQAVRLCEESCILLEANNIPVIRVGLMSSPSLLAKGQIVAGPWHPAFGFLVRSRIHQRKIEPYLPDPGTVSKFRIRAPEREIPLVFQ